MTFIILQFVMDIANSLKSLAQFSVNSGHEGFMTACLIDPLEKLGERPRESDVVLFEKERLNQFVDRIWIASLFSGKKMADNPDPGLLKRSDYDWFVAKKVLEMIYQ